MRTQLVLMAYNRPGYFRTVVAYWNAVRGLHDWTPLVSLDPSVQENQMLAIAADAGIPVVINAAVYGVLHHPWVILERAFANGADFAVIAEDDVVVSTDILEYFAWAAEYFADQHVLAVSARTCFPPDAGDRSDHVITHPWFMGMCWGTWADRWRSVLRDTWDHDYTSGTATESGWDWNINLRVKADWLVAAPLVARVDHIGADGVHTTSVTFPGSRSPGFTPYHPPGTYRHVADR